MREQREDDGYKRRNAIHGTRQKTPYKIHYRNYIPSTNINVRQKIASQHTDQTKVGYSFLKRSGLNTPMKYNMKYSI